MSEFNRNMAFIPIGKPINQDDVSIEENGELIATGPKVTNGYFGGVEEDKFFKRDERIWFKTGDIVEKKGEWFVCLGRKDSQVKISGHRIDLMEIEGNILLLDDVEAVVCIVKADKLSKFVASILITKKPPKKEKITSFLIIYKVITF